MNDVHRSLERLDLNLLVVFDAILRERNLTRAARRLFVSQSAVSHALARLRAQLGDALFVRRGAGVAPTAEAERLAPALQGALRLVREALEPREFEPARDLGRVALAVHEELEPAVLPRLVSSLRAQGAAVEVSCVRLDRPALARELGAGRLDLAIDVAQATGPELRQGPLLEDRLCVVARRRRRLEARSYLAAGHVAVSSRRTGPPYEDLLLSRLGYSRSIAVRCQRFETACRVVADSDLLLTAPRLHAQAIAARLGLVVLPLPFELPPLELHLYWHRQADADPRNRWLRGQLLAASRP